VPEDALGVYWTGSRGPPLTASEVTIYELESDTKSTTGSASVCRTVMAIEPVELTFGSSGRAVRRSGAWSSP